MNEFQSGARPNCLVTFVDDRYTFELLGFLKIQVEVSALK